MDDNKIISIVLEINSIKELLVALQQLAVNDNLDFINLDDYLTVPIGSLITISNTLIKFKEAVTNR